MALRDVTLAGHGYMGGEEIYHEGRFIGTVKQECPYWSADSWLDWGNVSVRGAASREEAIDDLIAHDAKQQRALAARAARVDRQIDDAREA